MNFLANPNAARLYFAAAFAVVCAASSQVWADDQLNAALARISALEQKIGRQAADPIHLHAILRPDGAGNWFIQNDANHASFGIEQKIEQTAESLRIFFCCGASGMKVGAIQISSDDDFGDRITGHAGVGRSSATIKVWADGQVIDPATIWDYVSTNGGNFWINVTMVP